jgi:outer membrane murein-binding lipoprotein Lpp
MNHANGSEHSTIPIFIESEDTIAHTAPCAKSKITQYSSTCGKIDGKIDRLTDDIQDLKHRVTSLEGQVASIRGDMAAMSFRIDRIETRLDRIERRLELVPTLAG